MKLTDKAASPTHRVLVRGKVIQTLHNLVSNGKVYVDQEDLVLFGNMPAYIDDQGRIKISMGSRVAGKKMLHSLILNACSPVDHINGNPNDNRRENLRIVTLSQNQWNRRINWNNKLKLKGVAFHKASNKFRARITVAGKEIYLGVFDSAQHASHEYNKAAVKYHGEFAVLNPI